MRPSSVLRLALVALAFLFGATGTARAEKTQAPQGMFVEWHGSWWAAHSTGKTSDGRTVVHYDGWGQEWDEVVGASRIAHATDDGKLYVSWGGSWWPATIVRQEQNGALRVHYDGWDDSWDESVDASRVLHLSR